MPEIAEGEGKGVDVIVRKGMRADMEMYSVFADAFGNFDCREAGGVSHDVVGLLRGKGVTSVFVVGLAGNYCVKETALDAARSGFETYVVREGVRCVDPEGGWEGAMGKLGEGGIRVVSEDGPEVAQVRNLATT